MDPYDGLDPDVIAFLDGAPPPGRPDVAPVGAGPAAQPAALTGTAAPTRPRQVRLPRPVAATGVGMSGPRGPRRRRPWW